MGAGASSTLKSAGTLKSVGRGSPGTGAAPGCRFVVVLFEGDELLPESLAGHIPEIPVDRPCGGSSPPRLADPLEKSLLYLLLGPGGGTRHRVGKAVK